jgi:hypothetical protein
MAVPLIYIAGPLGAPTPLAVRRNIEAARDLGLKVAEAGAYPVIPHCNTGEFYGHALHGSALHDEQVLWTPGALELLRRCDGIVCTPNWETSTGARAEVDWAMTADMPVHIYGDYGEKLREDRLRTFVGILVDRGADRRAFDRMKREGVTVLGRPE